MDSCKITSLKSVGTDGMYKATLSVNGHGAAIEVIGVDLTECVERAYKIVCTFRENRRWLPVGK